MAKDVDPSDVATSTQNEGKNKNTTPKTGKKVKKKVVEKTVQTTQPAKSKTAAKKGEADPFAEAMASLENGESGSDTTNSSLQPVKASPADTISIAGLKKEIDINFLMDIKLTVTFEVGRAKMFISDLLSLGQGSVIELHRLVGEDLEIFVNGQMLATGEVVVINEKFGARITKVLEPEERIQRLGPIS